MKVKTKSLEEYIDAIDNQFRGRALPVQKIEIREDGSPLSYIAGYQRPMNGFADAVSSMMINGYKYYIITVLKSRWWWTRPEKLVWALNAYVKKTLRGLFFREMNYTRSGQEFIKIAHKIEDERYKNIFRGLVMIWEFDNVYRLKGQKLFGIVRDKEWEKNPLNELIVAINKMDEQRLRNKMKLAKIALKLAKFKLKWLNDALKGLDLKKIRMDENDRYWAEIKKI